MYMIVFGFGRTGALRAHDPEASPTFQF